MENDKRTENETTKKDVLFKVLHGFWFYLLLIAVMFVIFLNFATANVVGVSMYPTYEDEDSLLLQKTNSLKRGSIVVVWSDQLNEYIVKRVIGIEGDFITIKDNKLYVNRELQDEPYINEPMEDNIDIHKVVEKGCIFVMGDNRNYSLDSRVLGSISLSEVKGVVLTDLTKTIHYNHSH